MWWCSASSMPTFTFSYPTSIPAQILILYIDQCACLPPYHRVAQPLRPVTRPSPFHRRLPATLPRFARPLLTWPRRSPPSYSPPLLGSQPTSFPFSRPSLSFTSAQNSAPLDKSGTA